MNDHDHTNPIDWTRQPGADRLRGVADGELAQSETASSDDRARVAFERTLRERVAETMGAVTAPAGLREQLAAALAEETGRAEHADRTARDNTPPVSTDPIRRTTTSFWAGGGRRWLGIAAAVALTATVFIISQKPSGPDITPLSQVAASVVAEHRGCLIDEAHMSLEGARPDPDSTPSAFIAAQIGDLPVHLELDHHGYRLAGLGGCDLAGSGKMVHLLYEPIAETGEPVSLFIQNASADHRGIREGVVYTNGVDETTRVRIWREGDVIYYMATSCPVGCSTVESVYALTGEQIPL